MFIVWKIPIKQTIYNFYYVYPTKLWIWVQQWSCAIRFLLNSWLLKSLTFFELFICFDQTSFLIKPVSLSQKLDGFWSNTFISEYIYVFPIDFWGNQQTFFHKWLVIIAKNYISNCLGKLEQCISFHKWCVSILRI